MKEILLPSLGEGVASGVIIGILVNEGDNLKSEQGIIEVETDKVTIEVPCKYAGLVTNVLVKEGDIISEGDIILRLQTNEITEPVNANINEKSVSKTTSQSLGNKEEKDARTSKLSHDISYSIATQSSSNARTIPRARKLARELGVNLNEVRTSNGLILSDNIKSFLRSGPLTSFSHNREDSSSKSSIGSNIALPSFSQWGDIEIEPMSGMMKATAKNMQQAWDNIPHAWLQEEANITILENERKSLNEQNGIKLSTTVYIIKAVVNCLREFPLFNASLDIERNQVVFKNYFNIGVAVDTNQGLYVPVIKNVDKLGLSGIGSELTNLSYAAKNKKLGTSELTGGNFTISNLGSLGTTAIFPIILPPQVAILGVAGYQMKKGQKQLPLTIGFDHRIINGADAARFMKHLKYLLEEPFMLTI